jgi:hypothetical protein
MGDQTGTIGACGEGLPAPTGGPFTLAFSRSSWASKARLASGESPASFFEASFIKAVPLSFHFNRLVAKSLFAIFLDNNRWIYAENISYARRCVNGQRFTGKEGRNTLLTFCSI